jgi:hypothetical protein
MPLIFGSFSTSFLNPGASNIEIWPPTFLNLNTRLVKAGFIYSLNATTPNTSLYICGALFEQIWDQVFGYV